MTTVINLYGGSGVGKSTTAAFIFAKMKTQKHQVELVREYVKLWAWSGRKVRPEDQIYLLGKQSAYESMLYTKVDYIVTDSPILLGGAYARIHSGERGDYVGKAAHQFVTNARDSGIEIHNFVIRRTKPYDPRGRYETESQASHNDTLIRAFLDDYNEPYSVVSGSEDTMADQIIRMVLS